MGRKEDKVVLVFHHQMKWSARIRIMARMHSPILVVLASTSVQNDNKNPPVRRKRTWRYGGA